MIDQGNNRNVLLIKSEDNMEEQLLNMRDMEINLFVIEFNKASQLDRSFSKRGLAENKKGEFRMKLLASSIELISKIDNNTLKNKDIREKIKDLVNIDPEHISFGQAQKVINVTLKQYCFITNNIKLLKELDCPLDSTTMQGYKIPHNQMINVNEEDYLKYQKEFEKEFNGFRILKDCKYDNNRMSQFLVEM